MPTDDAVLRLRPDATTWLASGGEAVLLDLDRARYLGVNRAGTILWTALADGSTRRELIGHLQRAYDLSDADAARDVDTFLQTCRDRDLLAG